jgi:hypothetical protein
LVFDYARQWQAAEKIVDSSTLAEPCSAQARIEHEFDPEAVRCLEAGADHDISPTYRLYNRLRTRGRLGFHCSRAL